MNALHRAILAVSVLLLASFSVAGKSQSAPRRNAVPEERAACPSTDFTVFFREFSEKSEAQKKFIHFPLVYGKVDLLSVPVPGIGYPFVEDKINSYDKIATLNHDNGLIFPDERERTVGRHPGTELYFSIQYGFEDDFRDAPAIADLGRNSDVATVVLYINESGYQVYYRFRKERNCWFLMRIDDWST